MAAAHLSLWRQGPETCQTPGHARKRQQALVCIAKTRTDEKAHRLPRVRIAEVVIASTAKSSGALSGLLYV
jgi:hypothetical protein